MMNVVFWSFVSLTVLLGIAVWRPVGLREQLVQNTRRRFDGAAACCQPVLFVVISFSSRCKRVGQLLLTNILLYLLWAAAELALGWLISFAVIEVAAVAAIIALIHHQIKDDLKDSDRIRTNMAEQAQLAGSTSR